MTLEYRQVVAWYVLVILALVGAFAFGRDWVWDNPRHTTRQPVAAATEAAPLSLTDRLVMTIAVGMDGSAIITDIGFASSDPREPRELELRGDTADANGVKGIPTEPGTWRCVVEEWANEYFREFRVTEARRLM